MRTTISRRQVVAGSSAQLIESFGGDPGRWLPVPLRPAGPHRWRVTLQAGPARHEAITEVGPLWALPEAYARRLRWWVNAGPQSAVSRRSRLFPRFEGHISLRGDGEETVVEVSGEYEPPGGIVGAVVDRIVLRHLARATVRRLAGTAAERLTNDVPVPT